MSSKTFKYLALFLFLAFLFYFFFSGTKAGPTTPTADDSNGTETPKPAERFNNGANNEIRDNSLAQADPAPVSAKAFEVESGAKAAPIAAADSIQQDPIAPSEKLKTAGAIADAATPTVKQQAPAAPAKTAQIIKTVYTAYDDIQPSTFTVKVNQPVRFEVYPKETDYGCMSTIMIPGLYETPKLIEAGKTIVLEFTPKQAGEYDITCAMGVPRGSIKVIE